jgi:hypothetical protein
LESTIRRKFKQTNELPLKQYTIDVCTIKYYARFYVNQLLVLLFLPSKTQFMFQIRIFKMRFITLIVLLTLFVSGKGQTNTLIISEIMAINDTVLADEDGDYSDWLEIYNPGSSPVNLSGWSLTDNPGNLDKWKFPNITINAGTYLVVFASDKNKVLLGGNLHTNFKLSGSGEYLALIESDGSTISSVFDPSFPSQTANVSYGLYNGSYMYMSTPTPGAGNVLGESIPEPVFSHVRGFYSSSISVNITSPIGGSDIYYTLDGTIPTTDNATKYSSALTINSTTVLSAITVNTSSLTESNVVTHTYVFPESVLNQPNNPIGYPEKWGMDYPADYEMDPEVCTEANKEKLIESLKSLPTVSFVTNKEHLFSHDDTDSTGGIYIYSTNHEEAWERPVSMEYFDSTQSKSVQLNCGLRIHGGNSRKPMNSPKHSFRVSFRSKYGPSKFNFNFFDEKSAENEFNSLVFRSGYNYSWIKNDPEQCAGSDYIRDPFTKVTQLDMDRTAAHNKFVHLYINGIYWGVYNVSEKITNDFAESYLGGNEDDYDVVKDHNGVVDGDLLAWNELLAAVTNGFSSDEDYFKVQGKNADGTINPSYKNLLDVRNFIDYMILNFYIGNGDWDRNNWIAARNRVTNEHGFKFFSWDPETSMIDVNDNMVGVNNSENPTGILAKLKENDEFKLYFADRIHKHFFNGGTLVPASTEARYMEIANTLEKSLLAESARWGDYRRDIDPGSKTYELYNPEDHWKVQVAFMQNTYFPQRTEIVFNQLKDAGLYPDIDAPVFSHFSGEFNNSISLSMSSGSGVIYYTTDNTDPRDIGGSASTGSAIYSTPLELSNEVIIKARVKDGDNWSALTRAKFKFNSGDDFTPPVLIAPENASFADADADLEFIWHKPENGVAESYNLVIYSGIDSIKINTISDTSYTLPMNSLEQNRQYSWYIKAISQELTATSQINQFSTNNIAPGPFSLISPANGDKINAAEGTDIVWTTSEDTEPVYYKLSITGNEFSEVFILQDTNYYLQPNTLKKEQLYIIQVSATDSIEYSYSQAITISTFENTNSIEVVAPESIADVLLYPNPATSKIMLDLWSHVEQNLTIEIYDIEGKLTKVLNFNNQFGRNSYSVNLDNFERGAYLMLVKSDLNGSHTIFSKKFLVH